MTSRRTLVQRMADNLDCDLYRVIGATEHLYDSIKRHTGPNVGELHKSLQALRGARSGIRNLMHDDDRQRTR